MRVTQVTVSYGATVNLGNYESLRADVSLTVDVQSGEDEVDAANVAMDTARRLLHGQLMESGNRAVHKWIEANRPAVFPASGE